MHTYKSIYHNSLFVYSTFLHVSTISFHHQGVYNQCQCLAELPDDDKKVSKHGGVYITQSDCCDIYVYYIIEHLLVIVKDARYMY